MAKIRLTKIFRFEMAHALWNYDGKCSNIHGHSYILKVTILGEPIQDENNPKLGMVMDFGDLKKIVNKEIVDVMDHAVVLSSKAPIEKFSGIHEMFDRHEYTDYQPTAENMVIDFSKRISAALPQSIELHSLRLYETANSYAEWFAEDQK